jgi:hypothetical protein
MADGRFACLFRFGAILRLLNCAQRRGAPRTVRKGASIAGFGGDIRRARPALEEKTKGGIIIPDNAKEKPEEVQAAGSNSSAANSRRTIYHYVRI